MKPKLEFMKIPHTAILQQADHKPQLSLVVVRGIGAVLKVSNAKFSVCRQTYSEMQAPSGDWKAILAGVLLGLSITGWMMIFMKQFVYPPLPRTITEEWKEANAKAMIIQRRGAVEGIGSKYDYENNKWK